MAKEYEKYIVSTKDVHTRLHRCFSDVLDSILREGLVMNSGGIDGNSTQQPEDIAAANVAYKDGRDHGDTEVVIQIPRKTWETARAKSRQSPGETREISYFHPTKRGYTIRPEFVIGSIDRNTDTFTENPHKDRKPAEGYQNFDFMFD